MVNITTPYGLFLKAIRKSHKEIAAEMAQKLGVSRSYLFSVSMGRRNIPPDWTKKLRDVYELSAGEMQAMQQAIFDTTGIIELDLSGLPQSKRALAISFSRQLPSLNDPTTSEIQQILDSCKNSEKV